MNKKWQLSLTITFLLLGILISAQLQTQNRLASSLSQQSTTDLTIIVKNLTEKRQSLAQAIEEMESNIATYKASYVDNTELIHQLDADISRSEMVIGAVPVQGPGISVVITKNNAMLYRDLLDIVNELWAAGAEAIAINDQRVTFNSNIYYAEISHETYLTLDGELLRYPLTISAIGDPDTLDKGLSLPGGILDVVATLGVHPSITHMEELHLPAAEALPELRSGKPVK